MEHTSSASREEAPLALSLSLSLFAAAVGSAAPCPPTRLGVLRRRWRRTAAAAAAVPVPMETEAAPAAAAAAAPTPLMGKVGKLGGFGMGKKRAAPKVVANVVEEEKKMGPLIPIEYSEEERAAVQDEPEPAPAAAPAAPLDAAAVKARGITEPPTAPPPWPSGEPCQHGVPQDNHQPVSHRCATPAHRS